MGAGPRGLVDEEVVDAPQTNEVHEGPGNFQCRKTFPPDPEAQRFREPLGTLLPEMEAPVKESFSGEDIYNLYHLFSQPFPEVQDPPPLQINNKLSISDIAELSCREINDLFNEGPDTHQAGVNSGIIAHFEEPSRMPDPGYRDSIMIHFSLPPLFMFMGAEADTDQSIHPEVPDMVHLNPPQLHMHAAEEGAVQRVQPQETSKPARSSADGKYPAPAIDKMMKFFAIMIRADHYLPVRNVVPVLSEMAVGAVRNTFISEEK